MHLVRKLLFLLLLLSAIIITTFSHINVQNHKRDDIDKKSLTRHSLAIIITNKKWHKMLLRNAICERKHWKTIKDTSQSKQSSDG